jgi:pyruvate,orthophosphate dikinase
LIIKLFDYLKPGKRSAIAAVKICMDLFNEKIISEKEAIMKIYPDTLH